MAVFGDRVRVLYETTVDFVHKVVVHRRDVAVRNWRSWVLEDGKVHPHRWLRPDLVAPAPFLSCDPGGKGVLWDPNRIDEQFRGAWLLSSAGLTGELLTILPLTRRLVVGSLACNKTGTEVYHLDNTLRSAVARNPRKPFPDLASVFFSNTKRRILHASGARHSPLNRFSNQCDLVHSFHW